MTQTVKIANWSYRTPLSIHMLLTGKCNISCPKCYYKNNGELDMNRILQFFNEWSQHNVRSLALGGGEPMLHPHIEEVTAEAKKRGFYVSVTTNGTILKNIYADRVHVSFDEIHQTTFNEAQRAIKYYSRKMQVGINHIVTDMRHLQEALKLPAPTIVLLMEKPRATFTDWKQAFKLAQKKHKRLWIDACLACKLGIAKCRQGVTSMSINQQGKASKCSNIKTKFEYSTLEETFKQVKTQECPLI
ncbi:MAG: radical SAM protein [Candidatus Bathyarchaeota archaeon]|nr:radical SAM protein [Candidatus Bathyarchaeota archaeon]